MVATGHPLELLYSASQLVEICTERPADRFAELVAGPSAGGPHSPRPGPSLAELVGSFLQAVVPETTALLAALGAVLPDEVLAARCRREVARRDHPLPDWLARFGDVRVVGVVEMVHVLGDGDNLLLGVRWPTGHELTATVYIDHNAGSLVKDAFLVPEPLADTVAAFERLADDDGETSFRPVDPADARARITNAIGLAEITMPPYTSDTWPACRTAIEWLVSHLPPGGATQPPPDWPPERLDDIAEAFFGSRFGAPLAARRPNHDLVRALLRFGGDYGPGDPLRWSPVAVEILLTDWVPRKVVASLADLERLPTVLRALIRYAHTQRGIGRRLTDDTLAAVDRFEPTYRRLLRTSRLLPGSTSDRLGAYVQANLERLAGGAVALERLDDRPLPDEPFDPGGVDPQHLPRLLAIVDLVDRCCDALLDPEYRTIAHRLLARAARRNAAAVVAIGRDEQVAAALLWVVARGNDRFGAGQPPLLVKDLVGWFGLRGSVAHKAAVLRALADLPGDPADGYEVLLGDPALLHSEYRACLIRRRDRHR